MGPMAFVQVIAVLFVFNWVSCALIYALYFHAADFTHWVLDGMKN